MTIQWGDKGAEHRPDRCNHAADDGCMWCCMRCNTDTHWCPDCGTVTDHRGAACEECEIVYREEDAEHGRRALHGLIGNLILVGLLAIGLAFTFVGGEPIGHPSWVRCGGTNATAC